MSTGSKIRSQNLAKLAYLFRMEGRTYRQIATDVGKPVEQVKKMILLGERLKSLEPKE
jgi:hypothetical protein